MEKPQVRIIEPQSEEISNNQVSNYERDQLLLKYGINSVDTYKTIDNLSRNLSFEEMISIEEQKQKEVRRKEEEKRNIPNPITLDSDKVSYFESKYSSINFDGSEFGIQVQIFSDIPINKKK